MSVGRSPAPALDALVRLGGRLGRAGGSRIGVVLGDVKGSSEATTDKRADPPDPVVVPLSLGVDVERVDKRRAECPGRIDRAASVGVKHGLSEVVAHANEKRAEVRVTLVGVKYQSHNEASDLEHAASTNEQ